MNLYEVAVLHMPKDDKGRVIGKDAKIILLEKTLAKDEQGAIMKVTRLITDGEVDSWDDVEVKVRPF